MTEVELIIDSVGVRGDGVAQYDGKPVYVPFTAPGDRVRVRLSREKGERRGDRCFTGDRPVGLFPGT